MIENVIGKVTQLAPADLEMHVPVAQMIGRPGELLRIRTGHNRNELGRSDDPNDVSVLAPEIVTAAKDRTARKLYSDFQTRLELGPLSGLLSLLETQDELVHSMQMRDLSGAQVLLKYGQRFHQNRK
jgi:hypothetical protein